MRQTLSITSALGFVLFAAVASAQAPAPPAITLADIRDAATRGFAAIQTAQKVSRTTQTCAGTCHLQGYGSLAYRSARAHGLTVDEDVAIADATRALTRRATDLVAAVEQNAQGEVAMSGALQLLGGHAVGLRPTLATATLARALALQQNPDGDWPAMPTRPPSNASPFAFTAIGLRAIQLYAHPTQAADATARVRRARAWLESHTARHTEDRAYQLLGLSWAGRTSRQLAGLARALVREQQSDGGWTSLAGRPSEAYATGQALVALHDAAGMTIADQSWKRGIAFLLRTQAADGTWHVRTRLPPWVSPPYYESGYPYGRDQFISVTGASWAVMALTRALPLTRDAGAVERLPLDALQGPPVESWVESAIFGSVHDLRRLLDAGLSPNATTALGRLPLLSLVVPDVSKVRLLLDRGAQVNARSQANYSPLLVAAQYSQSTAAIRLLLAHKADVVTPPGAATPFGNAYPTFFAVHAGNADILSAFHRAGDSVEAPAVSIGGTLRTPLALAVLLGRLDAARTLLNLGAEVDQPSGNGRTALAAAILSNRADMVRLVIDRGAKVNEVDRFGMTPLIYAATIDFGDSTVVDLLLRAGARTDLRDAEGVTALERARTNGNTHLIPILEAAGSARGGPD